MEEIGEPKRSPFRERRTKNTDIIVCRKRRQDPAQGGGATSGGLGRPTEPPFGGHRAKDVTSLPAENEEPSCKHPVSMARITYIDIHIPLFSSCITLGNSCSAYSHSFRAWMQGHCYCRHCLSNKACADDVTSASHMSHVTCVLLVPDLLLGSHKGSSMHAPEHPHQCKQYISLQSQTMHEMRGSVGIECGT